MGWGGNEGMTYPTLEDYKTWPEPNYISPLSREWAVIGVEAPLTFIAALFVAVRFYSRTYIKRVLGWDDWLMLASMVLSIIITIIHCLSTQYATGLHAWDIKWSWISITGKLTYTTMVLYAPTASLTKVSLSLTYLRILPSFSDRLFARLAIIFSVCYAISITSVMIFQCWPISSYWNASMRQYKCVNERGFNYAAASLNTFSDFLIFLWPIRTLWTVRIPIRRKLGLVFIFSVGALVCIAGVFRLVYLYKYFHTWDIYWEGAIVFILTCIETNVGIICGCLPGVKPLLNQLFPTYFGTSADHSHPSYTYTHRLPGARLSIRIPPDAHMANTRTYIHRPSSASMIEVPVKLDATWTPTGFTPPQAYHMRVMSDPGLAEQGHPQYYDFEDAHPGTKVNSI